MISETTLASPIQFKGVGLHTGEYAHLRIIPAPAQTGIVFQRTDLDNFPIEAISKNVAKVSYATTLMKKGVMISTVEHLMSALAGLEIDNAIIEIDNLEVPIMDGSAYPFVEKILEAGIKPLNVPRRYLQIRKAVHIKHQEKKISIYPSQVFQIEYSIDFHHPLVGRQHFEYHPPQIAYAEEVAPCRTFGFFHEVEELRKNGLIRGGSLENALVLTETGLMNGPLRFPSEFVRHKILDCLGDIALIGYPILGKIIANRAGHAMHTELATKIRSDRAAWEIVTADTFEEKGVDFAAMALPA